jgi:hypothetical protein
VETRNGGWEATAFSTLLVRLLFQRKIAGNASRWRQTSSGNPARFVDAADHGKHPAKLALYWAVDAKERARNLASDDLDTSLASPSNKFALSPIERFVHLAESL